jgi:AraC family transcriptional regulator
VTITAHRTRLRLFRALGRLPRAADLSDLALSAGFCSHSHFGTAFRRVFKTTPSRMRDELTAIG